jgi:hypothetical protein
MKYINVLVAMTVIVGLSACTEGGPAYWMTKYPGADKAKETACLEKAEAAYEKAGGTSGKGDNGFAVLAKGTAWEKCMEGK